jgi:hypothetical protein
VRGWLSEAGVKRHSGKPRKKRTISKAALRERYEDNGESIVSIARDLGVSRRPVRRWLVEAGVRIRRPGERAGGKKKGDVSGGDERGRGGGKNGPAPSRRNSLQSGTRADL